MSEPSFWGGNILWVSAKDMKCDVIIDTQDKITHKGAAALQMVNAESLVLVTRSGILKHSFPVAIVKTPCTINQDLKAFIPYCTEATQYLALCLRGLQAVILKRYRKKGMTVQSIIWESFIRMPIPLPSLAEQKRIVAKIEKLMPLVEEYGKMEETRLQLDADLPAMLEKSILQDAIQGKLVPQDPNDEPASELLKRIATERKALVKAGKLKRDKSETVIFRGSDRLAYETRNGETVCVQDEIPFDIPDSWEWVRLGSVCSIVRGSGIKRSETTDSGSPCIRYGEIYTTYGYSFQTAKSFTSEFVAAKCHKAHSGDVLCTLTGECKEEIAKATAYLGTEAIAIGGDLARISNHPYNPMLLVYFMFSPFMLSQKANKSNGDIIVHIGKEAIEDLLIPLPPKAEQERIVAKVANLLSTIKSFTT